MSEKYSIETIKKPLGKLVVKRNDFIDLRTVFSVREHKLINLLISKVNREHTSFDVIELSLKDIVQIINVTAKAQDTFELSKSNGRIMSELKEIISDIRKKDIWLVKNDYTYQSLSFFDTVELDTKNNLAKFLLHNNLKPYLLQQDREFTQYKLKNVIALKSKYSIILYELMKRKLVMGKDVIQLDKLRYILGVDEKIGLRVKLKNFSDFERIVLKRAQKELKQKTDIKFTYKTQKLGRRVECITFFPKSNNPLRKEEQSPTLFDNTIEATKNDAVSSKEAKLSALFDAFGINPSDRYKFLKIPPNRLSGEIIGYLKEKGLTYEDYLIEKLELSLSRIDSIKDNEAYLYKAITENYRSKVITENKNKIIKQRAKKQNKDAIKILEKKLAKLQIEKSKSIHPQIISILKNEVNSELEQVISQYFATEGSILAKDLYYKFDNDLLAFLISNTIAFASVASIIEIKYRHLLPEPIPTEIMNKIDEVTLQLKELKY